jgi:hypothetical protein
MISYQAGAKTRRRSASATVAHDARQPEISQPRQIMLTTFQTVFLLVYHKVPFTTSLCRRIDANAPSSPSLRPNSKVARLNPQRGGLEKANRGMNFSAMEPSVLIHALKQRLHPIRRVNQSGMRTNDHFLHSNSEMKRTKK